MTGKPTRSFFMRPALEVAVDLLGMRLVRKRERRLRTGVIVETEAYVGTRDRASHAYGGKMTPRNRSEYLRGGHVYIYLCYGLYWQLNITTLEEGIPECVLIRALEPEGIHDAPSGRELRELRKRTAGPGRLCRWLELDKSFDREDVTKSRRLWLEDGSGSVPRRRITKARRVGIDYAGQWARRLYRFYIRDNPFVSRP